MKRQTDRERRRGGYPIRPYVKYTCSANTEIFDFVGQVFPDTARATTGDAELDKEREQLMSMGGITYANVAALMKLPGLDDMDYDPEGVYEKLTGTKKPDATSQDCMGVVLDTVTDKVRLLSNVTEQANILPFLTISSLA